MDLSNIDINSKLTLHEAVARKRVSVVRDLLDRGANPNIKDITENTPLDAAIAAKDVQLVEMLIRAGADINACYRNWLTCFKIVRAGRPMISLLLQLGISVHKKCENGQILLHSAALLNRKGDNYADVLRFLLERGSNVNYPDDSGITPFHYVVTNSNADIIRLFREKGADVQQRDNHGMTALHHATIRAATNPENIKQLLDWGVDVNAIDNDSRTALYNVIKVRIWWSTNSLLTIKDRYRSVRLLLKSGADLKIKCGGNTILQTVQDEPDQSYIILEFIAVKDELGEQSTLSANDRQLIDSNEKLKTYFRRCQSELSVMRNRKIGETNVSFFNILAYDVHKIARCVRNKELVEAFKAADLEVFQIYGAQLGENFREGLERQPLVDSAAVILSDTLRFADSDHVAFEIILRYLSLENVQFLVNGV